jgi:hypothetical protein
MLRLFSLGFGQKLGFATCTHFNKPKNPQAIESLSTFKPIFQVFGPKLQSRMQERALDGHQTF